MNLNRNNECFKFMKRNGFRVTRSRIALLDVLNEEHLTFKEIQERLSQKGYTNVSSIYNNLEFFLNTKIITTLNIKGVKYYDLSLGNPMHQNESYIHMHNADTDRIIEINNGIIYDRIKEVVERDYGVNVDYIKIIIGSHSKPNN